MIKICPSCGCTMQLRKNSGVAIGSYLECAVCFFALLPGEDDKMSYWKLEHGWQEVPPGCLFVKKWERL